VIGAGLTGLSTALHLRRAGVGVVVVEAGEPGQGASGRNNGQVIPTLSRVDPDEIVRRHGDAGERLAALIASSAQDLFDLVREERIDAEAEQTGWVQPVHSPGRMRIAERRVSQWARYGAPVELLDAPALARKLGSSAWHGGWWNRSGGHVNPLALVRGLVRAVIRQGGQIYAGSPAIAVSRVGPTWIVTTERGRVTAPSIVFATNAYTSTVSGRLLPEAARQVVPVLSWQMATQPLSDGVRALVLPERNAVSDTHGELYFMRYDARHRLVTGGALIDPRNGAERLKPYVADRLQRLFPRLGDVSFDHVWNGYVGMTSDFLPRLHKVGPNGYAWLGCNGRAVGLSIALGREFARAIAGARHSDLGLPFTEPRPIRWHAAARRLAPLMLLAYRRRDAREV
jgi:glycine/D-amino acid oxidase-like deaminating enzyme